MRLDSYEAAGVFAALAVAQGCAAVNGGDAVSAPRPVDIACPAAVASTVAETKAPAKKVMSIPKTFDEFKEATALCGLSEAATDGMFDYINRIEMNKGCQTARFIRDSVEATIEQCQPVVGAGFMNYDYVKKDDRVMQVVKKAQEDILHAQKSLNRFKVDYPECFLK